MSKEEKVDYAKKSKEARKEVVDTKVTETPVEQKPEPHVDKKTYGRIGNVPLNLRENADLSANVLTVMPPNSKVVVYEKDGDWNKVGYNEFVGYCLAKHMKVM